MNKEQLKDILENHKKWLDGEKDGERANLSYTDLSDANLRRADLRGADLSDANLRGTDLSDANLSHATLIYTDMSHTDLSHTDLRGTDLRGADLDFSCLPLWCGSLGANFDDRQLIQIAYHLVKAGVNSNNASDETKKELSKLIDFANKFHRVKECGRIKKEVEE